MLSIENPPSDPPCAATPCEEISQLIKSCTSDDQERAISDDKVLLQEVDLLKSGLDVDDNHNPLPKFSIRDYVFSARSKDIKTNWPFSQKNLQLCLQHGVKDLLPPFQPLESVKNRSVERCTAETSLTEKENITQLDGEPSGPSDNFVCATSDDPECNQNLAVDCVNIGSSGSEGERDNNQNLAVDCVNIVSSGSEGERDNNQNLAVDCVNIGSSGSEGERDNQLPVTTNNQSHSEIDSIVIDKTQSKNPNPIKRCRLIVKVGSSGVDPSSNEDTTTGNCAAFSETMASKVCPVCKTFSSSSNTTLNAHIDQCLSLESNMKWTPNSRVTKHRVKPRKIRLMVDIYETASHCTLEELDRRNGTNWAMNSTFPTQEIVEHAEEEKERASMVCKEKGDEGAVYIDANGTKVRILSKFNDASSSVPKKEADLGTRKTFKGERGRKLLSNYKKKHHAQKHKKYLTLALQSKHSCSTKLRRSTEVRGDGERNSVSVENCRKVGSLSQPFKAQEQTKPNDSGTMMKWACSKRTGLSKRRNREEGLHRLGCNFRQELLAESDQSSLGDSYMERRGIEKTPNLYESSFSSPESRKRMSNSSLKTPINVCNEEEPCVTEKVGFTTFGSQVNGMERNPVSSAQRGVKRLRVDSTSGDGSCKDLANNGEHYVPFLGRDPVQKNASPVINNYRDVSSNLSWSHRAFATKAPKFSSLRKHVLSASQPSVPKSKYKVNKKCQSRKKSGMLCMSELDKEVTGLPSKVVENHDSKKNHTENQSQIPSKVSLCRSGVLKLRKKRGAFGISRNEESVSLKSLSEGHSHEVGNNPDSSARVGRDFEDTFDDTVSERIQTHGDKIVIGSSLGVDFGANPTSLSRLQSTDPGLGDEHAMFCVDGVGDSMIAQNTDLGEGGMDPKDGQGNYFIEVDPIPIPGPPGSFLPSPRDMGSEDLQGNSSITTSRVQSSEDHHDLVDRDSSDSPISAVSTVSHSMIARSDSKSSEKLSVGPQVSQDEIHFGFSAASSRDAVAENTAPVPQAAIQSERVDVDEMKVNMMVPAEKRLNSFRNDQLCCCSRKEGMSRDVSLNYQESSLLRRRTMASVPVPATGKQSSSEPNRRPNSLSSMPEVTSLNNFSVSKSIVPPSMKVSADSALNSPVYGDSESASPSASNSVLRLMGKNLMVVNKEENVSQQYRHAQPISPNDHPSPQFQMLSVVPPSPGISQNADYPSFYRMFHQHPNTGFGSYATSKTPQASPHASPGLFFGKNVGSDFTASLESHNQYKVRFNSHNDQYRSRNRNADSTSNPMKDVIIIDGTPVGEADSAADIAPFCEGTRENRASSAGISIPMAGNYNSRHVNPFCSYQPQDYSPNTGSQSHTVQSAGFQIPPHSKASASPINLRSPLYYSPRFS